MSHQEAKQIFADLRAKTAVLLTTSYVILETYALLGRRLGPTAVRAFREDFVPLLEVVWVDPDLHAKPPTKAHGYPRSANVSLAWTATRSSWLAKPSVAT